MRKVLLIGLVFFLIFNCAIDFVKGNLVGEWHSYYANNERQGVAYSILFQHKIIFTFRSDNSFKRYYKHNYRLSDNSEKVDEIEINGKYEIDNDIITLKYKQGNHEYEIKYTFHIEEDNLLLGSESYKRKK